MKIKTYLPIFSGFYNTCWELDLDNVLYSLNQDRQDNGFYSEIDYDMLDIDNESYELDIVKSFCDVLPDFMNDFINSIELEKIVSPKYYNFSNDSADVIIDINVYKIRDFIYSHKDNFIIWLKNKYTSCDGFISHYDNDFTSWEADTSNFTNFKINGHVLGSILDFIANELEVNELSIYESIMESICADMYITNYTELLEYTDNSLLEFLTSHGINKDVAGYYVTSYENREINNLCLSESVLTLFKEYENKLINA